MIKRLLHAPSVLRAVRGRTLLENHGLPLRMRSVTQACIERAICRSFSSTKGSNEEGDRHSSVVVPSIFDLVKVVDPSTGMFKTFFTAWMLRVMSQRTLNQDNLPAVSHECSFWNPIEFVDQSGQALLQFLERTHPFKTVEDFEEDNTECIKAMVLDEKLVGSWHNETTCFREEDLEHADVDLLEWKDSAYELVKTKGVESIYPSPNRLPLDEEDYTFPDPNSEGVQNGHLFLRITVNYDVRLVHPTNPLLALQHLVNVTYDGCLRGHEPLRWKIADISEVDVSDAAAVA